MAEKRSIQEILKAVKLAIADPKDKLKAAAPAMVDPKEKLKEIVDRTVDLESSDSIVQLAEMAGKTMGASRRLSWAVQLEMEEAVFLKPTTPSVKPPPKKMFAEAVGNRDVQNG